MTGPAVRSDVQRNRAALLAAARELLTARSDVPMYEVARRAGVGQATLYRHFPDRAALVTAVARENLEGFAADVAAVPPGPDAFATVLRMSADVMARSGAVIEILLAETGPSWQASGEHLVPAVGPLQDWFAELFEGPVRDAREAGVVDDGFGAGDALFVLAMVKGAIDLAGNEVPLRRVAAARAAEVALSGVLQRLGPAGR